MKEIFKKLEDLLDKELTELELGHGYNESRINLMFSILVMHGYLLFADITDEEFTSIVNLYL